jgi:hypothetical protein
MSQVPLALRARKGISLANRDRVRAIAAIDQNPAHAHVAHLGKGELGRADHSSASALPTPARFRPPGPPMFDFPRIAC